MIRLSLITCSLFLFVTSFISGQNQIPEVEILATELTTDFLNIDYSISDVDNSEFEVTVLLSSDGGKSYSEISNVSGDVGQVSMVGAKFIFIDKTVLGTDYVLRVVVDDNEIIDIDSLVAKVDSNVVRDYLENVEGVRHFITNLPHLEATRKYVLDHLDNMNLDTSLQSFPFTGGNEGQNLYGLDEGVSQVNGEYLVGGHYDTVDDSPGADDNGTAVAALMEIARVFKDYNFDNTVRYVSWDQEEAGLLGSTYFVNTANEDFDIRGYLNFEMLGYYSDKPNTQTLPNGFDFLFPDISQGVADDEFRGNFLTNVGNAMNSNTMMLQFDSIAGEFVPDLKVINIPSPGNGVSVPDLLRSDHAPFWIKGIPALMLTDASEFRNPNYHTELDVVDSLDMNFLTNNVKASVAYLAVKAGVNHKGFDSVSSSDINTSVWSPEWINDLTLFPNPTSEDLNVLFKLELEESSSLTITDVLGKLIYQTRIPQGTMEVKVPGTNFIPGQYILKIENEKASMSRVFIKE